MLARADRELIEAQLAIAAHVLRQAGS